MSMNINIPATQPRAPDFDFSDIFMPDKIPIPKLEKILPHKGQQLLLPLQTQQQSDAFPKQAEHHLLYRRA